MNKMSTLIVSNSNGEEIPFEIVDASARKNINIVKGDINNLISGTKDLFTESDKITIPPNTLIDITPLNILKECKGTYKIALEIRGMSSGSFITPLLYFTDDFTENGYYEFPHIVSTDNLIQFAFRGENTSSTDTIEIIPHAIPCVEGGELSVYMDKYNELDERITNIDDTEIRNSISELKSDLTGLQTVVDGKADKSELAKTNLYLDALYKLNKGQTYDVLEQESEAYSVDVPSGAKYVGIDKVGGKSVVWNQIIKSISDTKIDGGTISLSDGIATFTASKSGDQAYNTFPCINKHKYFAKAKFKTSSATADVKVRAFSMDIQGIESTEWQTGSSVGSVNGSGYMTIGIVDRRTSGFDAIDIAYFVVFDLTQMFGAGNEPSTVEEFEAMFPADYYPYSKPTIISSQTDRVDIVGKNLFNADAQIEDFTYVDSNGVAQTRKGIKITNENGTYTACANNPKGIVMYYYLGLKHRDGTMSRPESLPYFITVNTVNVKGTFTISDNDELWLYDASVPSSLMYIKDVVVQIEKGSAVTAYSPYSLHQIETGFPVLNSAGSVYDYINLNEGKLYTWTYTEGNEVKALAEPVITDIEIPTELTDWLTVEAGGSITFHNTDEGKRLLIPNKETFIRKLDEVTV